jgi:hypothetical protein
LCLLILSLGQLILSLGQLILSFGQLLFSLDGAMIVEKTLMQTFATQFTSTCDRGCTEWRSDPILKTPTYAENFPCGKIKEFHK